MITLATGCDRSSDPTLPYWAMASGDELRKRSIAETVMASVHGLMSSITGMHCKTEVHPETGELTVRYPDGISEGAARSAVREAFRTHGLAVQ